MALSEDAFEDPWRVVCPRDHSTLRWDRADRVAYCRQCGRCYSFGELVDKAQDDSAEGSSL